MKFLEILLSFAATQGKSMFQENTQSLSRHIAGNARKVAVLLSVTAISITLFCSGVSMGYTALIAGFENGDPWTWSAGLVGGLLLALVAAAGLAYSLGEKRWLAATGVPDEAPPQIKPEGPGLDTAFAMLISEVALHLKESRTHAHESSGESP